MTEPISDPFADRVSDPVVVGTDGSAGATRAVEWAAGHAVLQGLPLRVVHAVERLPYDGPRYPIPDSYDRLAPSGRQLLDHAERVARDRGPGLDVTTELAEGRPGRVLRDQAARASEVVLGSHGGGGFPGMLLGSVGNQVAGHVAVPVVVVRPEPPEAAAEIVAGFDCSEASGPALAYAFEEARLRGHRVRVVCAWEPPVPYGPVIGMDLDGMRRAAEDYARGELQPWRSRYADVKAELEMVRAHPVSALIEASSRAVLLVVGSHGRNAFTAAVLGSVSRAVLAHARCPVAVVRAR
ncbi:Nucleotide-binding universal stress protein, UspA family [Microbispora rosea]|uniref:Nucleotide-binding universal stress protein, UspA family n=1 Tax=Microbispora rosea TaxID=58117 RepID=A0A1N6XD60_9ACTN|nr:universal stress protein [Microbispora rosea]GIH52783.1 universal stress protein [Microbispora rosea subsp. rosea]SIR00197.1 Nucleotide-binding universal stress protein, UspA family [Microbispora rosea]